MNILVTGGAGFIGSHIVDLLIEKKHDVVIIDNLYTGSLENLNKKAKFYKIDIKDDLNEIFKKEKFDAVCHLAAQINLRKSVQDPIFDAQQNIMGSLNILELCRKYNVKKFVFTSTGGALYGDGSPIPTTEDEREKPLSPYGIAKLTVENYLRHYNKNFGIEFVCLRLANVYGPRQNPQGEAGVVSIFINEILNKKQPVIFGSGLQTRDYVYVKDVAKAFLLALKSNNQGVFNVGTAKETNVNEIFEKITSIMNVNIKSVHGEALKGEQMRSCLSYEKIKKVFGWKPNYDLEKGLKETVDYFKKKAIFINS